jgi:ribosomal protein L27
MAHGSIGNMTNTLIETGARHMQQCRTNFDVLVAMAGTEENLLNADDKWCMGKDELVVSCGKHLYKNATITGTKYAYPSVVTTLGTMSNDEKAYIASHYHFMGLTSVEQHKQKKQIFKDDKETGVAKQLRHFMPVGYSVGRACAHAYKGDTVASVQVGGLRTVINGPYEVQTGDMIQMFHPESEGALFNAEGGRNLHLDTNSIKVAINGHIGDTGISTSTKQRRDYYSRGLGVKSDGGGRVKTGMFSIKPYVESHNEGSHQYYGDRMRVFAKALSCARPYEPVDIMIARQAL